MSRTHISGSRSRHRFAHVNIRVDSDDDRAKLLATEELLFDEEGVEFDTGWNLDDGSRDWELDESLTGALSAREIVSRLRQAGFKFTVTWRTKQTRGAKSLGYREGDIVSLPVDDQGNRGYGSILVEKSPLIFLGFFGFVRKEDPPIEIFGSLEPILRIYTTDQGIVGKTWKVLGNIPITRPVPLPQFWWSYDKPDKRLLLFRSHLADYRTGRETSLDEIKRVGAQPYGIFGHGAAQIHLAERLRNAGLLPP